MMSKYFYLQTTINRLFTSSPLCFPLRGNISLGGNNLFAACYHDVGRKKNIEND